MKDLATRQRFIELRAQGWSYNRIAEELKTSKQTLIKWGQEYSYEIGDRKDLELEALHEKYLMGRQARIALFGERLVALKKEAEERPLDGIPVAKLYELIDRYAELLAIEKEKDSLTFRTDEQREQAKVNAAESAAKMDELMSSFKL